LATSARRLTGLPEAGAPGPLGVFHEQGTKIREWHRSLLAGSENSDDGTITERSIAEGKETLS
jgi:hypothetical protein